MFVRVMVEMNRRIIASKSTFGPLMEAEPGDIIEIVDQTDSNWWQALKLSSPYEHMAYLIPSPRRLEELIQKQLLDLFSQDPSLTKLVKFKFKRPQNEDLIINELSSHSLSEIQIFDEHLGNSHISSSSGNVSQKFKHLLRGSSKQNLANGHEPISNNTNGIDDEDHFNMDDEFLYLIEEATTEENSPSSDFLNKSLSTKSSSKSSASLNQRSLVKSCKSLSDQEPISWVQMAPILFSNMSNTSYEDVVPVSNFRYRSLILIGANGVGKAVVKKGLVKAFPDLFVLPIVHTNRPRPANGIDDKHYHFVSTEEMKRLLANECFMECVSYKKYLYGVTKDSVQRLKYLERVSIFDFELECLPMIRTSTYKPLIIFIACDPELPLTRPSDKHKIFNSDLQRFMRESELIQQVYRAYINFIVVQRNVDDTIAAIGAIFHKLTKKPQWVPKAWL